MLLRDFFAALESRQEGGAFKKICREYGLSYKNLRPYLKQIGYDFNMQTKQYDYKGTDPQPLDLNLLEVVPARISITEAPRLHSVEDTEAQIAAAAAEDPQPQPASVDPSPQQHILYDKLFDIVDLLQQINQKLPEGKAAAQPFDPALEDPEAAPLALQLHRISQHSKARKTINIAEEAAAWLDSYSDSKAFKIGDLVTLAVLQLQKRIDPTYEKKAQD